jgi:hypothetical protein
LNEAIHQHCYYTLNRIRDFIQKDNSSHFDVSLENRHKNDSYLAIHMFEHYYLHVSIDWRNGKFVLSLKKDNSGTSFDLQSIQDQLNQHDELKTKQPFGRMLLHIIEKARQQIIIYAYSNASKLLGLDTFRFLSGLDREREQRSEMLFVRFPEYSDVFISIKANSTAKNKPVSCRIIYQVSPRLTEKKVSDQLFPDEGRNGHISKQSNHMNGNGNGSITDDEQPPLKKKQRHFNENNRSNLLAYKHLRKIIEGSKNMVGRYLIIGQLESKDGLVNFQTI